MKRFYKFQTNETVSLFKENHMRQIQSVMVGNGGGR